ncbi:hypothetical protein VPH35_051279 [Triticum aestivum]
MVEQCQTESNNDAGTRSFIVPYRRCKRLELHALTCNILQLNAACQYGTPRVVSACVLLMLLANPFGSESLCVLVCSLVYFRVTSFYSFLFLSLRIVWKLK